MTLFRELSNEESRLVKKWRAPLLADEGNPPSTRLDDVMPIEDNADISATDIAHLRDVVREAQSSTIASNDAYMSSSEQDADGTVNTSSSGVLGPSADMLQDTYNEGYAAGVQANESRTNGATLDTLTELLNSLAPQKYQLDARIEAELIKLTKAMAKLVLRKELSMSPDTIQELVRNALSKMPVASEPPKVVLNPEDMMALNSIEGMHIQAELITDSSMLRGECRIESGASLLDAGITALVDSISSKSGTP